MCVRDQTRAAGRDSRASGTGWTILREEEKERERERQIERQSACGCWLRHCVCVCVSLRERETSALRRAPNSSANHAHWNRPPTQPGSAAANALSSSPKRGENEKGRGQKEGKGGKEKKTSVLVRLHRAFPGACLRSTPDCSGTRIHTHSCTPGALCDKVICCKERENLGLI